MLFKEYKKARIERSEYYYLLQTLKDLYGDELDEMFIYPQDILNEKYENGRLLLIFSEKYLIKVIFSESTVYTKPVKYEEVKYAFFREENINPNLSQPGALILNLDGEEIKLSPIEDFSSYSAVKHLDLTTTLYKFLTTK